MSNRIIKFRAWQKTHKYMTDDISMQQLKGETNFYYGDSDDGIRIDDDWALMQFTGLLDKNGKEIFECDVVDHFNYPGQKKLTRREVVFQNGAFGYIGDWNNFISYAQNSNFNFKEIQIIGNLYSNPELLKS